MRRAGRFLAAARTPLRQMGCCPLVLVRGWWWDVDVLAASPRNSKRDSAATSPPRASARPQCPRERRSGSPRESEPATAPRRPRPPSPGSRDACAGPQPPPAPAPQLSSQGSGRSRSHDRARVRRSVNAPRLGRPLIAPARPSSAPRGGARVPAPLPGLRQRALTRHRSRRIRQRPLCASPSPRPRRTTWRGTPSPA